MVEQENSLLQQVEDIEERDRLLVYAAAGRHRTESIKH